jgi:hypothetical protein
VENTFLRLDVQAHIISQLLSRFEITDSEKMLDYEAINALVVEKFACCQVVAVCLRNSIKYGMVILYKIYYRCVFVRT